MDAPARRLLRPACSDLRHAATSRLALSSRPRTLHTVRQMHPRPPNSLCPDLQVKSIQMFRRPARAAAQGDRAALLVTQLDPKLMERGLAAAPGSVPAFCGAVATVEKVRFFDGACWGLFGPCKALECTPGGAPGRLSQQGACLVYSDFAASGGQLPARLLAPPLNELLSAPSCSITLAVPACRLWALSPGSRCLCCLRQCRPRPHPRVPASLSSPLPQALFLGRSSTTSTWATRQ
jgi:hypothetical protein